MKQKNVPELTPTAREVFMPNQRGVGFDASTKASRLALISEDNGRCSVFVETVDVNKVVPLVEHVAEINHLTLVRDRSVGKGDLTSHYFKLTVRSHVFTLGVSVGTRPRAPFHAALTLAP